MSILTDVKNILKGVNILAPQKDTQETGTPFLAPQPQIFKPITQATPFVPTETRWDRVSNFLNKWFDKVFWDNDSIEGGFISLPSFPTRSTAPSTPRPRMISEGIGKTVDFVAPQQEQKALKQSEQEIKDLKYLDRLEEKEWKWFRSWIASIGDFVTPWKWENLAFNWFWIPGLLATKTYNQIKWNINKWFSDYVKDYAENKIQQYEEDPYINEKYREIQHKYIEWLNKQTSDWLKDTIESQNWIAQSNTVKALAKSTSEIQNKIMPGAVVILWQADLERKRWNIEKADAMEASVRQNMDSVSKNATDLIKMSSLIQDIHWVNTAEAQWELYRELSKQGHNINSFMMRGLVDINNEPLDQTYAEVGTRYDALNNQSADIGFENIRDKYYAWSTDPLDWYWFIAWAANQLTRWIFQKAARDLWTTPANVAQGIRTAYTDDVWFVDVSGKYWDFFLSADTLYASDLWFLWWLSVSEQKAGIKDLVNEYTSQILDKMPETVVSIATAFGTAKVGMNPSAINWLKANQWLNTSLAIAGDWWITSMMKWLGLRILADTMVNANIDSYMQSAYAPSNIMANLIWFSVGDIYETVQAGKQLNRLRNIGSSTNYSDISWIIRETAVTTKTQEFVKEGMSAEEALQKAKWLSDEQLVGTKINAEYIDGRIKDIEEVNKLKKEIGDNYTTSINEQRLLREQTVKPEEIEKIDANISLLQWEKKMFEKSFDSSIVMANAAKKFAYNPTVEGALEYAQTLKLHLPNTENPNAVLRSINSLPDEVASRVREWLWDIAQWTSMVKYIDGWTKYRQAVDAWFTPEKIFNSKSIDDVIKNSENKDVIKRIGDRWDDGELKYFNKVDGWENYMLNKEWFAKLNLEEKDSYVNLYRNMWNNQASQEKFIETMREVADGNALKIPEEDLIKIEEGNLYEVLVKEIDEFIPCVL